LDRMRGVFEPQANATPASHEHAHDDTGPDGGEVRLLEDISRVRPELNALYSRFQDENYARATGDASWRAAVNRREAELNALEDRLSATRGLGGLFAPTATLDQVRSIVPHDAALVEFFVADGELLAFVVDRRGEQVFRRLAGEADVQTALKRVQFQMNRALRPGAIEGERGERLVADARRELNRLHQLTLQPMRERLRGARRLIIVPHGVLHLAPFHALWDGERYLVETHEICFASSASLLLHLRRMNQDQSHNQEFHQAMVVGVDDALAPQIASEALEVAGALQCPSHRVFNGAQATVRRVRDAAKSASVLHLACHGRFASDAPQGSGLKLADGWLTVRDICSMELRADLVTLSGCETGLNQVQGGDELMGLLRGFFAAGARSLLVSLWRVDDAAARAFMSRFYQAYRVAQPSAMSQCRTTGAAALRSAQLSMMQQSKHPARWAPFMVAGGVE